VFRFSGHERVVALAWLSDRVPDQFIAEKLAEGVNAETGRRVALVTLKQEGTVHFGDPINGSQLNGELSSARNGEALSAGWGWVNEQTRLAGLLAGLESPVAQYRLHLTAEETDAGALTTVISQLRERFHYILLNTASDAPCALLLESVVRADRAFVFLQATSHDLYHRELLLRVLHGHPKGDALDLKTIICREQGEDHLNGLLKDMGNAVHGFVHGCPPPALAHDLKHWGEKQFHADIRRLAREIGHCRVGLALSSGGARGLAHIGVIQVLEENGIEVDVIAGCSMGAYVGAVWAYGYDGITMERLAREVEKRWGLFELIDPFILPRQGFLRGEKVKRRLKRSIGDAHFSELVRPLRIVATNLATLERAVLSSGEVAAAVHASSAIPGACVPVELSGESYIDGGIADPLPVDVLEEMGVERIIAVNTIPTAPFLRRRYEMERERTAHRRKQPNRIKAAINKYLNYFAPGNVLDTILRSFHGAQMRVAEMACLHADLVLRPLSFDGRWHDFRRPGKYIALGRREAEEHLDEIKALVAQKESINEPQLAQNTVGSVT
jgi:NTE family protein